MHREFGRRFAIAISEVAIETIGEEGRHGRNQFGQSKQTGIKCLVCGEFVGGHFTGPETFAVEAHIPVAEVVEHEVVDGTSGFSRFVVVEGFIYGNNERIEF